MSSKLRLLKKRRNATVINAHTAIDYKLAHLFKNEDLKKFGFNKFNPEYTLDVNSTVNVSDDYYIQGERYLPTGTILPFAGSSLPGVFWLICNGQALSTITYSKLFDIIGYTYGGSDESFNLPDLRGRVPIGAGTGSGLTARSLAATGGAETHTLTINEIPAHTHNYSGVGSQGAASGLDNVAENNPRPPETTSSTGGGQAHNNMQPFIVLNYIIRI